MVAGRRQTAHDLHHCTVVDLGVATHIDLIVQTAVPRFADRLELRDQILDRNFLILQEHLAVDGYRNRERLVVLTERLGLALRQLYRNTDRQQRRRDHEDDQQHQHDVYERRYVDVAHDGSASTAAATTAT